MSIPLPKQTDKQDRRSFIGGSDARIIMGDDEAALLRLWREKRGEVDPEDLSGNLIVQLGSVTEQLNRHWYEHNTGQANGNRVPRRRATGQNGSSEGATSYGAIQQVTPLRKPVRMRDRNHLRFVSTQPCLACGRIPSDAHHLRFAQERALGRKVSDEFTVPLCRLHHRELHQRGDELLWWRHLNVNPLDTAQRLWRATHQDSEAHAFQCET
jgi:hypothetical protein